MKTTTFFRTLLLALLMAAVGNGAMAQTTNYEPYDFREVNADGDTLYYRITSDSEPYTVAVTRCHDSIYHTLPHPSYEWQIGQPGFVYPVYDYDSLLNIPSSVTHEGVTYTVTAIDNEAFYYQKGIREVNLPATIETIDEAAFYLSSLSRISVQEGVKRINRGAFTNTLIQEIVLPASLLYIGVFSFKGCSRLQSIIIPDDITKIPFSCFSYCDSLNHIELPNSIDTIEECAFYSTPSLQEVTLPSQVKYIGHRAFTYNNSSYPFGKKFFSLKCENPPILEYQAIICDTVTFEVPCGLLAAYQNAWPQQYDYYITNLVIFAEDCDAVEEHTDDDIKIYPNPISDVIHIEGLGNGNHQIYVYDMLGKVVCSAKASDNSTYINIAHLPEGMYIVKIDGTNDGTYGMKVCKK